MLKKSEVEKLGRDLAKLKELPDRDSREAHLSETYGKGNGGKPRLQSFPSVMWPVIMSLLDPSITSRKRKYPLKRIFDALLYITRTGCQWRQLPTVYPPWETVYYYFRQWTASGLFENLNANVVALCRTIAGRQACPSLTILDSRSMQGSHFLLRTLSGYDGGKKTKGRKQQIIVDVNGFVIDVYVHPANIHDSVGGREAVKRLRFLSEREVRKLLADSGYRGNEMKKAADEANWTIVIRPRNLETNEFTPEPKRWIVERTNSWMEGFRRLARDYERLDESVESFVFIANLAIMLNRIDCQFVDGVDNAVAKGCDWTRKASETAAV